MSTATAERSTAERPQGKPRKVLARFPSKFNRAVQDLGPDVANLGFSVDKEFLTATAADEFLAGHRLSLRLTIGDGDPDQKTFWDGASGDMQAFAVVKGFRCGPKKISSTLIFQVEGMDVKVLKSFAKKSGWMFILKAEQVEMDDPEDSDSDEGSDEQDDAE